MDYVISCEKTKYSSNLLAEVVDGKVRMIGYWSRDTGLVSDEITKIKKGSNISEDG